MNRPRKYEVNWTETASELLGKVSDARVRQKIYDIATRLEHEPDKQGSPLGYELVGFRDLRAVGQRYRIIYQVSRSSDIVFVWVVGIRKQGSRADVYELAKKLFRLGLIGESRGSSKKKKK